MEKNQRSRKNLSFLMLAFLLVLPTSSYTLSWPELMTNWYNKYRSQSIESTVCQILPTAAIMALVGGSWWYSAYLARQREARQQEAMLRAHLLQEAPFRERLKQAGEHRREISDRQLAAEIQNCREIEKMKREKALQRRLEQEQLKMQKLTEQQQLTPSN